MLCRRLQDLTYCISYNVNFFNDKEHGAKQFRKKYKILEELGRGGFGIVYKAERNDDNASVAVKFVEHRRVREWTMKCKQLIPTEICLLDICRGVPGVVQLIDWFANSKGFLIVMERPQQCLDLFDLISIYGYLNEDIARSIFIQILNTTHLLYSTYGIFHRDIKDENIIINMRTGEAILVDFGAAAFISEACIKEFQGTRSYCPPEWFKRLAYKPLEATVWSLGIVLYVMVSGCLPFQNEIQICLGRFIIPKHISKDCENLLRQCLAVTPSRRPDLLEILKHRWLNQPIAVHSESFKIALQRHLQRKKEVRDENKLKQGGRIQDKDKKSFIVNKCAKVNEFATTRNISTNSNISARNSPIIPLQSYDNSTFNYELLKKYRHYSSYDNVVINERTNKITRQECYEIDNNILIHPNSIAEESECSDSQFCSDFESFSMISTDPQNSESYVTALEDEKECFFQRSQESTAIETFNNNSRTQTPSFCDNNSNYGNEELVQVNCPNRSIESIHSQKAMNSRLVAKHWLQNIAPTSKYGSLKLQRPLIYPEKDDSQKEAIVNRNLLKIFDTELR
ncbi:Protein kinase domain family protein [Acanthocheilonema viteae]